MPYRSKLLDQRDILPQPQPATATKTSVMALEVTLPEGLYTKYRGTKAPEVREYT